MLGVRLTAFNRGVSANCIAHGVVTVIEAIGSSLGELLRIRCAPQYKIRIENHCNSHYPQVIITFRAVDGSNVVCWVHCGSELSIYESSSINWVTQQVILKQYGVDLTDPDSIQTVLDWLEVNRYIV